VEGSPPPRRIVTAIGADGLSYIARVEEIPVAPPPADRPLDSVYPGWREGNIPEMRIAWACDPLPFRLPVDPSVTPALGHPGPLGMRISIVEYPPGWRGEMFWSNRVDFLVVIEGELTYRTDSGDEIVVAPGDVVVQNGTNKAFENNGDGPLRFAAVLFGAERQAGPTPPREQFHGRPDELPPTAEEEE
jgi:quercetin dioxygenase-like cupin family protein